MTTSGPFQKEEPTTNQTSNRYAGYATHKKEIEPPMPSRIIREGFVDSEAVCSLSDWAHRVYSNLLLKVDDAGRYDARLEILRSHLFPLGTVRRAQEINQAMLEFESTALVSRYHFAGNPFLQVARWQRTGNAQKSKFPWSDGCIEITYVMLDTKYGKKEFVSTSIPPPSMPSVSHTDGVPTPPNNEYRKTNDESLEGGLGETKKPALKAPEMKELPTHLNTARMQNKWAVWMTVRRGNRNKPKNWVILFNEQIEILSELTEREAFETLRASIQGNWQGLFPPNKTGRGKTIEPKDHSKGFFEQ